MQETDAEIDEVDEMRRLRYSMVEQQIKARGIIDNRVLNAVREVPRHLFVPLNLRDSAYDDAPLPIGMGQTISQPYIVALMTELLKLPAGANVLEIGTGSGYQAAVLSRIAKKVYTVERIPQLQEQAKKIWCQLGYDNIEPFIGDGWKGLPEYSPYDGIIVTAAAEQVPENMLEQLSIGARLVIPIGNIYQRLWIFERTAQGFERIPSIAVRFVPLIRNNVE